MNKTLLTTALIHGGFTYCLKTGKLLGNYFNQLPIGGWAVSIAGHERRLDLASKDLGDQIQQYCVDQNDTLQLPNRYLGGWVQGNELVLDCTAIVGSREEAMKLAEENRQLEVYCYDSNECIKADWRGEQRDEPKK